MPGRKPTPAYMFDIDNSSAKKTKAEIERLKSKTIIIGGNVFTIPNTVKKNKTAKNKWFEIMELYKDTELPITTSADIGLLERYCMTWWEYQELIKTKFEIYKKYKGDAIKAAEKINELRIDSKLNQKNNVLLRMDTELFLTPLSKCRATPRTPQKDPKKQKLKNAGFNL